MDKVQAINSFWNSFGIKAYDETTVPDEMSFNNIKNENKNPYITYEVSIGEFGEDIASAVNVWFYADGWKDIESKVKEIDQQLSNGGVQIPYDDGSIWIKKGTPYRQRVGDSNDMVRRYLINTIIEYH
jgi:hypothetical protein